MPGIILSALAITSSLVITFDGDSRNSLVIPTLSSSIQALEAILSQSISLPYAFARQRTAGELPIWRPGIRPMSRALNVYSARTLFGAAIAG